MASVELSMLCVVTDLRRLEGLHRLASRGFVSFLSEGHHVLLIELFEGRTGGHIRSGSGQCVRKITCFGHYNFSVFEGFNFGFGGGLF